MRTNHHPPPQYPCPTLKEALEDDAVATKISNAFGAEIISHRGETVAELEYGWVFRHFLHRPPQHLSPMSALE